MIILHSQIFIDKPPNLFADERGFALLIFNAKINFLRIQKVNLFETSRCLFQDGKLVRSHDDAGHVIGD